MASQSSSTRGDGNQDGSLPAAFASIRRATDRHGSARVPRPTSTGPYSGPRPIWRQNYSIFNITIMAIERTPGWKAACQSRLLTDLHAQQISLHTGGGGTVEGCTRLQSPHNFIKSPWTGGRKMIMSYLRKVEMSY